MKPKSFGMSLLVLVPSLAALGAEPEKRLPRVFIIGDSISLGYTDLVRQELRGVAEVSRPNANCAFSQNGLPLESLGVYSLFVTVTRRIHAKG